MSGLPDPDAMVAALVTEGWTVVGHGPHHTRLKREESDRHSIVVPMDPSAPEYGQLMPGVLAEIWEAAERGLAAHAVLRRLGLALEMVV